MPPTIPALSWTDRQTKAVERKHTDPAARAALTIWESARELDNELSASVVDAAAAAGMTCDALPQRILSPLELRDAIMRYQDSRASVHGDYRASETAVIDSLGGPFRFALRVANHDQLPRAAVEFVRTLQVGGWRVDEIAHSYHDESLRKAFTLIATAECGGRTKIRVHSDDSIAAEELAAAAWAIYTDPARPIPERQAAKGQCRESAALVPSPEGLARITAIGGVPVSIKLYT